MPERDGCVVETTPLSLIVQAFCDKWEQSRPLRVGGNAHRVHRADATRFVSAISWLAQESGVSPDTIQRVKSGNGSVTEYWIADRLITVMGEQLAFTDGRLQVKPNPWARREKQLECCGTFAPEARFLVEDLRGDASRATAL